MAIYQMKDKFPSDFLRRFVTNFIEIRFILLERCVRGSEIKYVFDVSAFNTLSSISAGVVHWQNEPRLQLSVKF